MEGGCFCGAVRYSVSGPPFAAEYCHCRMCQKSTGAMTIASLDDPNLVKPTRHIFTDSQVRWLNIDDDCKRFPEGLAKSSG